MSDKNYVLSAVAWLAEEARIPDAAAKQVVEVLARENVFDDLELWEAKDPSKGGAPGTLTLKAVLVGAVLSAIFRKSGNVTDITKVLYAQLNPAMRRSLGVENCPPTGSAYDRTWRTWKKLVRLMDPAVAPRNRHEPKPFTPPTAEQVAEFERRLQQIAFKIVDASVGLTPEEVFGTWTGAKAVDATAIAQYTRLIRKGKVITVDPEAGVYVRPGKAGPPFDKTKGTIPFVGYDITAVCMGHGDYEDTVAPHPNLILAIRVEPCGEAPGEHAAVLFEHLHARYAKPGLVAGDRAYNNSMPEKFQDVILRLGELPLYDYKIDQLGVQAHYKGAIQVEGTWYCPSMPLRNINATKDFRDEKIDFAAWIKLIDERRHYELRVKDGNDGRYRCPALGASPSVGCELRHGESATMRGKTLIAVIPSDPDLVCTNTTSISIPPNVGSKHGQALPYGSALWQRMYNRLRNTIESLNGTLKDGPIRDAQRRRGRGKAIQTILSAVFVFAANVEKLITWLHDTFRGKKYLDVPTRRPRAPRKRVLIGRVDRRTRRRHDRHLTLT